jgi:uncharacterized membrane protein HdeD (DUF308 family)
MNEVNTEVADHGTSGTGWITILGIVTIILGIIAIGSPLMTGSVVSAVIGIALVIVGILELVIAFVADSFKAGAVAFIGGAITIVAGGLLIARPVVGSAVLTVILGIYFLIDGIYRISLSFKVRPISGWGWMLFVGVISILLAILIWSHWPLSGLWAVGVLVGIRILFAGLGMLFSAR